MEKEAGGVIYPAVGFLRDSLSGIALILELLTREDKKISEIVGGLPKYFMKKEKVAFTGGLPEILEKLKKEFADATMDTRDGIRFDWPDSAWIHIRPSNTEPIIRTFGEAKTQEQIDSLFNRARLTLNSK